MNIPPIKNVFKQLIDEFKRFINEDEQDHLEKLIELISGKNLDSLSTAIQIGVGLYGSPYKFLKEVIKRTYWCVKDLGLISKKMTDEDVFKCLSTKGKSTHHFSPVYYEDFDIKFFDCECLKYHNIEDVLYIRYFSIIKNFDKIPTSVKSLRIFKCTSGIENLKGIGNLVNLRDLYIEDSIVHTLGDISKCTNLSFLRVVNSQLKSLDGIQYLDKLDVFKIPDNNVSIISNFINGRPNVLSTLVINNNPLNRGELTKIKKAGHRIKPQ